MLTKHLNAPFAVKALSERGAFEGYASVFAQEDSLGDVVAPGAFAASLAEHAAAGTWPAMLLNHDPDQEIGEWLEIREDARGLFVSGRLWIDGAHPDAGALKAYRGMRKARGRMGLSIGFVTRQAEREPESGRRLLTEVELWEVSPVVFPALASARVQAVKAASLPIGPTRALARETRARTAVMVRAGNTQRPAPARYASQALLQLAQRLRGKTAALAGKGAFSVEAPALRWGAWVGIFAQDGVIDPDAEYHQMVVNVSFDSEGFSPSTFDVEIRGGDQFISTVGPGSERITITGDVATALYIRCRSHALRQVVVVSTY